jgi:LPPG:FO 2-phospho-L-lactate transferase
VVRGFKFQNAESSEPAPGVLKSIDLADMVIICPSNPFVSVDPILAIPGVKDAVVSRMRKGIPVVAISPIIGGITVKGPAAKMFSELGFDPSASAVSNHYSGIINGFVFDQIDSGELDSIALGVRTRITDTLMPDIKERKRLASEVIAFGREVRDQPADSIE